jgi:hypothetical protein
MICTPHGRVNEVIPAAGNVAQCYSTYSLQTSCMFSLSAERLQRKGSKKPQSLSRFKAPEVIRTMPNHHKCQS